MKKTLFVVLLTILFVACKQEPGSVSGVIVCAGDGGKEFPDFGSQVYLTQEDTDTLSLSTDIFDVKEQMDLIEFCENKIEEYQTLSDETNKEKIDARIVLLKKQIEVAKGTIATTDKHNKKYKPSELAKDAVAVENIAGRAYAKFFLMSTSEKVIKAGADTGGNYKFENVAPGKYSVVVVSGNAKRSNVLETTGKVSVNSIEVKSKENTVLNIKLWF